MKINKYTIALLLACVCSFASCSKENEPELPQGPVEVVLAFAAVAETSATKAATEGPGIAGAEPENIIGKLATLIFDNTGKLLGYSTKTADGGTTITEAEPVLVKIAREEISYTAVLVANYGADFKPGSMSTLEMFKKAILTEDISAYTEKSQLPMVSKEIVFSGATLKEKDGAGTKNWIKDAGGVIFSTTNPKTDPVKLKRLISRVDVEGIAAKFTKYEKASLRIDSFALINVCSKATIEMGVGDIVKGHQYAYYKEDQKWINPSSRIVAQLAGKGNWEGEGGTFHDGLSLTKKSEYGYGWSQAIFSSYTFSNKSTGAYKTALLISGWFKYDKEDTKEVEKRRHYRVFLADPDLNPEFQVRPNYLYKISVTITGEGSENEDKIETNADVAVKIIPQPWISKNQNVEEEI